MNLAMSCKVSSRTWGQGTSGVSNSGGYQGFPDHRHERPPEECRRLGCRCISNQGVPDKQSAQAFDFILRRRETAGAGQLGLGDAV